MRTPPCLGSSVDLVHDFNLAVPVSRASDGDNGSTFLVGCH